MLELLSKQLTGQRAPRRPKLLLLYALPQLLMACALQPPAPPPSVAVESQRIPPMPATARQPQTPAWCSPTCSDVLETDSRSWEDLLMRAASPAAPASVSGTR